MRLVLTGRQVDITPAIRRLVERKLARLDRVLNTKAVSGQVELRLEKFRHVTEIHVHARGDHMLQARSAATSWDESMAESVDRLVQQAQKMKGKWEERRRQGRPLQRTLAPESGARLAKIIRAKRYPVKTMTVDEAARTVAGTRDAFLVFRNALTDEVSVMFRRADGDLGLIEPGA